MPSTIIRQRPLWVLIGAVAVASLLSVSAFSLLVEDANEARRDRDLLCEAINGANSGLRNLLISARAQTPKRSLSRRARRFYREQLAALRPLDCDNFDRDSLRRQQRRAVRAAQGGDGTARAQAQQPP
jgi:hypothetical protein